MKTTTLALLIIGGYVAYQAYTAFVLNAHLVATGTDPTLPRGPTVYPDPITSVQAGGQGGSVQSLAVASMYGVNFNG